MMWILRLLIVAGFAGPSGSGLTGDWMTPGGSVIRVSECGDAVCMTVVKLTPTAPGTHDVKNPDKALRDRSICQMTIGQGFRSAGENVAEGGKIYDPESGKTYSAKVERSGEQLKLRGYMGISMFGRTETWKKVPTVEACH